MRMVVVVLGLLVASCQPTAWVYTYTANAPPTQARWVVVPVYNGQVK
jgi:hypothetical protein